MTSLAERGQIILLVSEAVTSGACQARACSVISLNPCLMSKSLIKSLAKVGVHV